MWWVWDNQNKQFEIGGSSFDIFGYIWYTPLCDTVPQITNPITLKIVRFPNDGTPKIYRSRAKPTFPRTYGKGEGLTWAEFPTDLFRKTWDEVESKDAKDPPQKLVGTSFNHVTTGKKKTVDQLGGPPQNCDRLLLEREGITRKHGNLNFTMPPSPLLPSFAHVKKDIGNASFQ